jgi:hypothetical protein
VAVDIFCIEINEEKIKVVRFLGNTTVSEEEKEEDFLKMSYIQHCFICRLSISMVPEDAGIEPETFY